MAQFVYPWTPEVHAVKLIKFHGNRRAVLSALDRYDRTKAGGSMGRKERAHVKALRAVLEPVS